MFINIIFSIVLTVLYEFNVNSNGEYQPSGIQSLDFEKEFGACTFVI